MHRVDASLVTEVSGFGGYVVFYLPFNLFASEKFGCFSFIRKVVGGVSVFENFSKNKEFF